MCVRRFYWKFQKHPEENLIITVLIFPFYSPYIDRLPLLRSVQTIHIVIVQSLSNYDGDGNENVKKMIVFIEDLTHAF